MTTLSRHAHVWLSPRTIKTHSHETPRPTYSHSVQFLYLSKGQCWLGVREGAKNGLTVSAPGQDAICPPWLLSLPYIFLVPPAFPLSPPRLLLCPSPVLFSSSCFLGLSFLLAQPWVHSSPKKNSYQPSTRDLPATSLYPHFSASEPSPSLQFRRVRR